jgi:hypothetical protein
MEAVIIQGQRRQVIRNQATRREVKRKMSRE